MSTEQKKMVILVVEWVQHMLQEILAGGCVEYASL